MYGVYAHIEIVVTFLVVNVSGFLVITRNPTMHFGPKLEEIFLSASRSFLYLSGTCLKAINLLYRTQNCVRIKLYKNLFVLYFSSFSYIFLLNQEFPISPLWGNPGSEVPHLRVLAGATSFAGSVEKIMP